MSADFILPMFQLHYISAVLYVCMYVCIFSGSLTIVALQSPICRNVPAAQ